VTKSRGGDHEFLQTDEYEAWNALLMLNKSVLAELDTELRGAHHLTVTEFDVLITLYNAENRRLGMSALADRVLLSPAGTTHLVTRLERDGYVRREVDPGDGRKFFTVLTPAGDDLLRAARLTHNDVLRRSFFSVTSSADRRTLQRVWRRLRGRLTPLDEAR
jgi:DNA-binding MarR family transcriptional regulator